MSENEKEEIEVEDDADEDNPIAPIAKQGPLETVDQGPLGDTEDAEDEDAEDEDEELDHPLDILSDVIDSVKSQMIRVKRTKSIHNLKQELLYNIYPTMLRGFESIADYISGIEQEDEDGIAQEIAMAQVREILTVCKKIEFLKDYFFDQITEDGHKKLWTEITDWADNAIEQTDDEVIDEIIKDIPEIESTNTDE